MPTKTDICNKALSALGSGSTTQDVETEKSQEAKVCNLWYDGTRDEVLRDFDWPFATKRAVPLGVVLTDPLTQWSFAYRYPSDCLRIQKIESGVRSPRRSEVISHILGADDAGTLIYTNQEDACLTYTFRHTNVLFYPPDFQHTLALLLSSYIAPRLMGGDRFNMAEKVFKLYVVHATKTKASAMNEQISDQEPESTFVKERNA